MVVRKRKKILKRRGQRSPGYGSSKKHRGGGSRGGRGNAGLHKHKIHAMIKYMPDHYGKDGFRRPYAKIIKVINLGELDKKLVNWIEQKKIKEDKDGLKLNLSELGYDKLLGDGQVKHKIIVEGKAFSKLAVKKIEESGGKTVVVS